MEMHRGEGGEQGKAFPCPLCPVPPAPGCGVTPGQSRQQTAKAGTRGRLLRVAGGDTGCHKRAVPTQAKGTAGDTSQLPRLSSAGTATPALQGQKLFLRSRTEHVPFY